MLLAYCAAQTLNAVHEPWSGRRGGPAHADALAAALQLDPVAAGWRTTAQNYLGQVSKARILAAVVEAKGEAAAERIESLRKADMAREAETLLAGSTWLPEPLRHPAPASSTEPTASADVAAAPDENDAPAEADTPAYAIAAE